MSLFAEGLSRWRVCAPPIANDVFHGRSTDEARTRTDKIRFFVRDQSALAAHNNPLSVYVRVPSVERPCKMPIP